MSDLKNLTAEELVELAMGEPPVSPLDNLKQHSQVQQFILSDDIKPGNYLVSAMLIFDRYLRWTKLHNQDVLHERTFFRDFMRFFERVQTNTSFYKLSVEGFNLSAEHMEKLKRTRMSNAKKRQKKSLQSQEEDS